MVTLSARHFALHNVLYLFALLMTRGFLSSSRCLYVSCNILETVHVTNVVLGQLLRVFAFRFVLLDEQYRPLFFYVSKQVHEIVYALSYFIYECAFD